MIHGGSPQSLRSHVHVCSMPSGLLQPQTQAGSSRVRQGFVECVGSRVANFRRFLKVHSGPAKPGETLHAFGASEYRCRIQRLSPRRILGPDHDWRAAVIKQDASSGEFGGVGSHEKESQIGTGRFQVRELKQF